MKRYFPPRVPAAHDRQKGRLVLTIASPLPDEMAREPRPAAKMAGAATAASNDREAALARGRHGGTDRTNNPVGAPHSARLRRAEEAPGCHRVAPAERVRQVGGEGAKGRSTLHPSFRRPDAAQRHTKTWLHPMTMTSVPTSQARR